MAVVSPSVVARGRVAVLVSPSVVLPGLGAMGRHVAVEVASVLCLEERQPQ